MNYGRGNHELGTMFTACPRRILLHINHGRFLWGDVWKMKELKKFAPDPVWQSDDKDHSLYLKIQTAQMSVLIDCWQAVDPLGNTGNFLQKQLPLKSKMFKKKTRSKWESNFVTSPLRQNLKKIEQNLRFKISVLCAALSVSYQIS